MEPDEFLTAPRLGGLIVLLAVLGLGFFLWQPAQTRSNNPADDNLTGTNFTDPVVMNDSSNFTDPAVYNTSDEEEDAAATYNGSGNFSDPMVMNDSGSETSDAVYSADFTIKSGTLSPDSVTSTAPAQVTVENMDSQAYSVRITGITALTVPATSAANATISETGSYTLRIEETNTTATLVLES